MPPEKPKQIRPDMDKHREKSSVEQERLKKNFDTLRSEAKDAENIAADERITNMMDDREKSRMVLAAVERKKDGNEQWLHEGERMLIPLFHEKYANLPVQIEKQKDIQTKNIQTYLAALQKAVENIEEAKKLYEGDFKNIDFALLLIDQKRKDITALQDHQHALVDAAYILVRRDATAADFKNVFNAVSVQRAFRAFINGLPSDGTLLTENQHKEAVAYLQSESDLSFGSIAKVGLKSVMGFIDKSLHDLEVEQAQLIAKSFPERGEYLRRLGGASVDGMIAMAIVDTAKNEIDLKQLRLNIAALGGNISISDLQEATDITRTTGVLTDKGREKLQEILKTLKLPNASGAPIITDAIRGAMINKATREIDLDQLQTDLLKYNIPSDRKELSRVTGIEDKGELTKAAEDQLKAYLETLNIDNPAFVSLRNLAIRAALPTAMANELQGKDMQNISLSTLLHLATDTNLDLNKTVIDAALASAILKEISSSHLLANGDEEVIVDRDDFVQLFTLILLKLAETSAASKERAEILFAALVTDGSLAEQKNGTYLLKDKTKFMDLLTKQTIGERAKDYIRRMKEAKVGQELWTDKIKNNVAAAANIIEAGGTIWWNYVKNIPKDFHYPEIDDKLLALLNQQSALNTYKKSIQSALDAGEATKDTVGRSFMTIKAEEEARQKVMDEIDSQAAGPLEPLKKQRLHLEASAYIFEKIDTNYPKLPNDVRDVAYWIAITKGMKTMEDYLAGKYKLNDTEKKELQAFLEKELLLEESDGKDVLLEMKNDTGLEVAGPVLDILAKTKHPTEEAMLAASSARPSNWLEHPPLAAPALEAIIVPNGATKRAIIEAFCTGQPVTYKGSDGSNKTMEPVRARKFVIDVLQHLEYQGRDFEISTRAADKANRYSSPLDILKTGAGSLMDMLKSGDRVEQALALSMIVATVYALYKGWQRGGWTKKLIIGIPIFFGADALLKKMKGKGILDYVGLNYMNEEDRNGGVEQFMRAHESADKYSFMTTAAGQEAVRQLMKTKNDIPVSELLAWRTRVGATPHGVKYSDLPPSELSAPVSRVVAAMGSMDTQGMTSQAKKERAYEYLYLVFDALCMDVAERNGVSQPSAEKGAEIIHDRYVTFEDMATAPFRDILKQKHPAGFTVLDVLVYERPTPAMQEALTSMTMIEYFCNRTGVAKDFVIAKLKQGFSYGQIYAEYYASKAPEAAEQAWEFTKQSTKDVYDWFRVSGAKLWPDLKQNAETVYRMAAEAISSAGLFLKTKGPDAVEWIFDSTVSLGSFTIDKAQDLYRYLQSIGLTGQLLKGLDNLSLSVFGFTVSEYILYKDAVEKKKDQVKELSDTNKRTEDLLESIKVLAPAPTEKQLSDWLKAAVPLVVVGKTEMKDLTPHEKMMVYELVKRHIYSYLIGRRIEALDPHAPKSGPFSYPLQNVRWDELSIKEKDPTDSPLINEIENSYGLNTLHFFGAERTRFIGAYDKIIKQLPPGYKRMGGEFLHMIVDWASRDDSIEYLQAVNEYYIHFVKEAEDYLATQTMDEKEKEKILNSYKAYLETVLTNAVADMTLRTFTPPNSLPLSKANQKQTPEPLAVAVAQAKNFLTFLRVSRGSSPDLSQLNKANFDAFSIDAYGPTLQTIEKDEQFMNAIRTYSVSQINETLPPVGLAPSANPLELSTTQKAELDEALDHDVSASPLSLAEVNALQKGVDNTELTKDQQNKSKDKLKLNFDTHWKTKPVNLADAKTREEYSTYLRFIDDPADRKIIEKNFYDYMSDPTKVGMKELVDTSVIRDQEVRPEGRARLQRMLDVGVITLLKQIVDDMSKFEEKDFASNDITKKTRMDKWEQDLLRIYSVTNPLPDKVSDIVSRAIEYLWYQGNHEGYDKYAQRLADESQQLLAKKEIYRALTPPPENVAEYIYGKETRWNKVTGEYTSRSSAPTRLSRQPVLLQANGKFGQISLIKEDIERLYGELKPD